jgi:hypothetical protein
VSNVTASISKKKIKLGLACGKAKNRNEIFKKNGHFIDAPHQ